MNTVSYFKILDEDDGNAKLNALQKQWFFNIRIQNLVLFKQLFLAMSIKEEYNILHWQYTFNSNQ